MMKNYLFLLFGLLLAACTSDDEVQPGFVTNVVMPASGRVFNPGDQVTVTAEGFQPDDGIMFDIRWPLPDELIKEGFAKGVYAVITQRSATSITFLAPGHHPASTTEVLLNRSGEMMSLGKIAVADGQAPKEYQLYGIVNSRSDAFAQYAHVIEHIDIESHRITEVGRLVAGEDFFCAVNAPGSWSLCGVRTRDGSSTVGRYDLSMRYWDELRTGQMVTAGSLPDRDVVYVYQSGDGLLLSIASVMPYSRMAMPPLQQPTYQLPEAIRPEALSNYPCVLVDGGYLLLSADNGDGTFSPVLLNLRAGHHSVYVGEPIQAVSLIPFWMVKPNADGKTGTRVGGYIVSETNGTTNGAGGTKLCLWNTDTMTLDAPFTTFPNAACSVATLMSDDLKRQELYVLFDMGRDGGNGRLIEVYDCLKDEWRYLSSGFAYSEIVLAK